jgi:AAA+ ATPase superfamily predicted ATPase
MRQQPCLNHTDFERAVRLASNQPPHKPLFWQNLIATMTTLQKNADDLTYNIICIILIKIMLYKLNLDSSPFVGRGKELELLNQLCHSAKAELLILYGRRRVGKTRLLSYWLDTTQPSVLFWTAEPSSQLDQLRSFSQAIANFRDPNSPPPAMFTYASWEQAFRELARLSQEERLVVFLDEFTYLLEVDPAIAGTLQNLWDHVLKNANLFLCLSGSHLGMMQRHILSYQAPLYGRATALLRLDPLWFGITTQYFPQYSPDERITVYAMAGGIPAYWELFDPDIRLDANIRQQFLTTNRLLHDEPSLLLQDFISDAHNYVGILRALAFGYRTPKEIAGFTGLPETHIPAYLSKLIDTGFIERRVPVTAPPSSRLGRHHIIDPFLRFYYRFLSQRQPQLAAGVSDKAMAEMKRHLGDFIGINTWEELCREWLLRIYDDPRLPFIPDQVGSAWTRKSQVDVVGYNSMEKTLILGECKWHSRSVGRKALADLVAKTSEIVPKSGTWRVYYLGFARVGWTKDAHAFANEISDSGVKGENWESTGIALLDLNQIDKDLTAWTV